MNLLTLVPFWYRWAAIGLLVIAVWGHGYVRGREAGQEKVEQITEQIQLARDQQALQTAQKVIADKEKLNHVVEDFHGNLSALNAYWLRHKATAVVPANPTAPTGTPVGQPDAVSPGSCAELEQACAITTAMFNACRDGWIGQEAK